jgi:hypothetical protein
MANRLLDHNPRQFPVTRQSNLSQEFWYFTEYVRRYGHVKDAVGFGTPCLFKLRTVFTQDRIRLQLHEIALLITNMPCKLAPLTGFYYPLT